VTESSLWLCTQ